MHNQSDKKTEELKPLEPVEIMPPVDIVEDLDTYIMYFEVPGTNASTLQRRHRPVLFKRVFRLSKAVDVNKITAAVADGVLTLKLPKADHVKPFKVPVA